ncbi:hypothetical protein ES708_28946 [subsurface metagenome]
MAGLPSLFSPRGQYRTRVLDRQVGRGGIERERKEEILNWPEWTGGTVTAILNMGFVVLVLLVMFGLLGVAGVAVWRVAQMIMRKRG